MSLPDLPQQTGGPEEPTWAIASPSTVPTTAPSTAAPAPVTPTPTAAEPTASRRYLMVAAGAAGAVALVAGGFLAATSFNDSSSASTTTTQAGAVPQNGQQGQLPQNGQQGMGQGQGQGQAGMDGGPPGMDSATMTAGKITAVSGSSFTLQSFDGSDVTVTTTSATTVPSGALAVGQVVFVAGTRTGDDRFTATQVMTRPQFGDGTRDGDGPPGGVDPDGDHQGGVTT